MSPKSTSDRGDAILTSLRSGEDSGPHLDEKDLRALIQDELSQELADQLDSHLAKCSICNSRFLTLLPDTADTEPAEDAPLSGPSPEPAILALIGGSPNSLGEIAMSTGMPKRIFDEAVTQTEALLTRELAGLLQRAEEQARAVAGRRYDLWKARFGVATPEPEARQDVVFASSSSPLELFPTSGPHKDDRRYLLSLSPETRWGKEGTRVSLTIPSKAKITSWGYRIEFHPEEQTKALEHLGFTPALLGVLRVLAGEERWRSLLDLLLPHRFGVAGDDVFGRASDERWIPGHIPGSPIWTKFWLG
jgi:hypothetical protein